MTHHPEYGILILGGSTCRLPTQRQHSSFTSRRCMKSIIGIALFVGALAGTARSSTPPTDQTPVTYQVPASWKRMKNDSPAGKGHTVMYEVTAGVESDDHPVVMLKTYELPPGLRMDNINVGEAAKQVIPSGVPVSCADDGPNWRTCVFLGRVDDSKIIALYRIGIQDGYVAEEVFIFPMPTTKSEELALLTVYGQADQQGRTTGVYTPLQSTYKTISIFNEFTKMLAINGRAPFNAKAVMGRPTDTKPSAVYRWVNSPSSSRSTGG
jgi:hypothetical protein